MINEAHGNKTHAMYIAHNSGNKRRKKTQQIMQLKFSERPRGWNLTFHRLLQFTCQSTPPPFLTFEISCQKQPVTISDSNSLQIIQSSSQNHPIWPEQFFFLIK